MKLDIQKIEFTAKEGPTGETLPPPFKNWEDANAQLSRWRWFAPNDGSYYKTDFTVTFSDGSEYSGRIDLERNQYITLQSHMRQHLAFILNPEKDEYTDAQNAELRNLCAKSVPEAARLFKSVNWF